MPLQLPASELSWAGGRLRSWTVDDAAALVAAWNDPLVARFNGVPQQPTVELARTWITGERARLDRQLSLDLVIDCGGAVQGEVGLSGFSERHSGAVIGYWLMPNARGKGLASAAVHALCSWAHVALELDVIVAQCHPKNLQSHRVAERAGFVCEGNDADGNQLWRSRTRG